MDQESEEIQQSYAELRAAKLAVTELRTKIKKQRMKEARERDAQWAANAAARREASKKAAARYSKGEVNTYNRIQRACTTFFKKLGPHAKDQRVFTLLNELGKLRGLQLFVDDDESITFIEFREPDAATTKELSNKEQDVAA